MYHQCKALIIKKQAGEFVKVIEVLLMWGKAWQLAEKEMASQFSQREGGETSVS